MKAKIRFLIGHRASRPLDVYIEIYKSRDFRPRFYTRVTVASEKNWDSLRQLVIKQSNSEITNQYLTEIKQRIEEADAKAEIEGRFLSKTDFKHLLSGSFLETNQKKVVETFKQYNDNDYQQKLIKPKTYEKYQYLISLLQKFVDEYKGEPNADITFREFNANFLRDFEIKLQSERQNATAISVHKLFKRYFKTAILAGLIDKSPYEFFKYRKSHAKERCVLLESDLHALEQLDRDELQAIDYGLSEVLDRFLLSCYCGLRISDSLSLLKREVREGANDEMIIDKITEKMDGKRVILPLHLLFAAKGRDIIHRYLYLYPDIPTIFPNMCRTGINTRLKTLIKLAKLPTNTTFHTARHRILSFAL